jgi:hypothetical protein
MSSTPSFETTEELKQIFLDKGSEIVAFVNKNGNEIELTGWPGKTQLVQWRCANEPEHITTTMVSVMLKREYYLCLSCARRAYKTLQELLDKFEEKGSRILAIIDKDGNETPVTFVPEGSTKIKWVCAKNETHIFTSPLKNVTNGDRELYVCHSCARKDENGPTYDSFVEQLESEGWTMVSDESVYQNNKSVLQAICNEGHETRTSQNNFSMGHRCKKCARANQRVHTIEDISVEFAEKGFELKAVEYINNSTPLEYICKCGRERTITYSNFTKNTSGCNGCTRRWTIAEVEDFFEDAGCDIVDLCTEEFVLNSTGIYYICICGMDHFSSWKSFKKGARCPECTVKRIKETCMKKYGVDNASKSEEIKAKIVQTMRERYDVDYATQVVEFMERNKQTNLNNHGGVHNLATPEIRKLSVDAYTQKYGDKFGRVKEHQDKATKVCLQKFGTKRYIGSDHYKQRMMMDHGQEYFANSEAFYTIMIKRYGVKHALQNAELFDKMVKSSFSLKEYILPSGEVCMVQGYEPYALRDILVKDIDDKHIQEDDIKTGSKNVPFLEYYTDDGTYHKYFPDIYIPSLNMIIEIKSTYTLLLDYEKNLAKFTAGFSSEYIFEVWIYDNKGERVDQITYISDILFAYDE